MGNCIRLCLNWFYSFHSYHIAGKRLRQIKQIAEGGYGYVSLVEDIETLRNYAMKKLICQSSQQLQMYQNEVKVMKELSHCQHVIGYHGCYEIKRDDYMQAYILMEYCPRTVFDLLVETEKEGALKLSEQKILKILKDAALGLQEMHNVGILHQDVKTENILLTKEGVGKLCDFGSCSKDKIDLAKVPKSKIYKYEERFEKNTTLMYRPPEMIDMYLKYPVDERVDIWMLGCVLFVMNFRFHPFQEEGKLSIVNSSIRYPKECSSNMENLMRNMLTPNPYFRPSLEQILTSIQNWEVKNIELNQIARKIKNNEQYVLRQEYDKVVQQDWHAMRPQQQIEYNDQ